MLLSEEWHINHMAQSPASGSLFLGLPSSSAMGWPGWQAGRLVLQALKCAMAFRLPHTWITL